MHLVPEAKKLKKREPMAAVDYCNGKITLNPPLRSNRPSTYKKKAVKKKAYKKHGNSRFTSKITDHVERTDHITTHKTHVLNFYIDGKNVTIDEMAIFFERSDLFITRFSKTYCKCLYRGSICEFKKEVRDKNIYKVKFDNGEVAVGNSVEIADLLDTIPSQVLYISQRKACRSRNYKIEVME